jgi:hypothetical protein
MENNTMWYSAGASASNHRWYCGTTQVMNLTTTGLQMPAATTIAAANITVSGNLTVAGAITNTGPMFQYQDVIQDIGNETLTMAKLLKGILLNSSTTGITANLPSGSDVYNSLLAVGNSIDWTVISYGVNVSYCIIGTFGSANHGVFGDMYVAAGKSVTFRTRVASTTVATTYRIS